MVPYGLCMPSQEHAPGRTPPPIGVGTLDELYEQFRRPAFALARRILLEDSLAEDVVQEVFLAVWRDLGGFDAARGSFSSWLMAMVHHKAVDAVRREEAFRRRQLRAGGGLPDPDAHGVRDVADEACDREAHSRVRTALSALPAGQREALTLAYFSGYTQREIATLTATPLGTVKSRTLSGVRQLRRDLQRLAPGPAAAH
jgi:RNA polymerase sigma-70 factor (ECF subfamily)